MRIQSIEKWELKPQSMGDGQVDPRGKELTETTIEMEIQVSPFGFV
jgi:hypothetical protein